MPKVLYYLQHLLGTGHLFRSAKIIRGLCKNGFDIELVLGGVPCSNIDFGQALVHQLDPVRSEDMQFSRLVTADGAIFTQVAKQQRCGQLLDVADKIRPDIIVTESYPFGRRMMRFELLPLLQWARAQRPRPMIVSSIRDILQQRKAERVDETIDLVKEFYDHILIHGDPDFIPLELSFPAAGAIRGRCQYTGYVADENMGEAFSRQKGEGVLVSIGGGAVGSQVLQSAIDLCLSGFLKEQRWTVLAGPNLPQYAFSHLQGYQRNGLQVSRNRDDFPQMLKGCRLSVSMAGYNTMMEILQAEAPAVVIPFEGESETEQVIRAERLADMGRLIVVREGNLHPDALKNAMEKALKLPPVATGIDMGGVDRSVRLLWQWWNTHG